MSPEDTHNNAQQNKSDKTPKYPSPRLVTAAIYGRFFGFSVHYATANSILSISGGSSWSARDLFTRFDEFLDSTSFFATASRVLLTILSRPSKAIRTALQATDAPQKSSQLPNKGFRATPAP
jgi:hypothetical protein